MPFRILFWTTIVDEDSRVSYSRMRVIVPVFPPVPRVVPPMRRKNSFIDSPRGIFRASSAVRYPCSTWWDRTTAEVMT